jgi:hypothetical protein
MPEYGGYIEFEYYHGKLYHENAVALNSGRHCVEYLIKTKHIKKIHMPYFMCDSVPELCDKLGVEVERYHTDINFVPQFDKNLNDGEWLYIVNFYGQLPDALIVWFKEKYGRVIVDNAQDFFRKPIKGVDTVYTCRKFFGVPDGGYLYTDTLFDGELPQDYSYNRMNFLFGRMEKTASEFYSEYAANNKMFASEPLKRMSKLTQNLMCGMEYERIKDVRTENFQYMYSRLRDINRLELTVPEGAFMYPLYIENGDEVRKQLQQKKIYIPTLWPDVFDICREGELEYDMAMNILPLPVDHRYGQEDMEYLINTIKDE